MKKYFRKCIAFLFTIACLCLAGNAQAAEIPGTPIGSLAFQSSSATLSQSIYFSGDSVQCYTYIPESTGYYGFVLDGMRMELCDSLGETLSTGQPCLLKQGETYSFYFYPEVYSGMGSIRIDPTVSFGSDDVITLVSGGKLQLTVLNQAWAQSLSFSSSDTSVVTVDENGWLAGSQTGSATVTISGTTVTGASISDSVSVIVTNPALDQASLSMNLYTGSEIDYGDYDGYYLCEGNQLLLSGVTEYNRIEARVLNSNGNVTDKVIAAAEWDWYSDSFQIAVYPQKAGDYTLEVSVDGKILTCELNIINLYFKKNAKTVADNKSARWVPGYSMLALYPGETTTLTVKNAPGSVKWKSSDTGVAKVSSSGKVTARRAGYATISATCGGHTITYEVGVAHKTAILALRKCYQMYGNTVYSQPKRMSSGYADCSSFIWKGYKSAGKYLGNSSYALTAAALSDWCQRQGYRMFYGEADVSALLPGDLIFWCGANNGRSDGIYHVDLYQGLGITLTVEKEKYFSGTLNNVIIARPCMQATPGVKVKAAGGRKLTLSWNKVYGVTGYEIYQSTSANGTYTKAGSVKGDASTSWTSEKLKSGKTYYYKIRPYWRANKKTYRAAFSSSAHAKVKK